MIEHHPLPSGISQREFMTVYILNALLNKDNYATALHKQLSSHFPNKVHSYDYLCKTAIHMSDEGLITITKIERINSFSITSKGMERLILYQDSFSQRIREVKVVVDRFVSELSGAPAPATYTMAEEYSHYFSTLVSVKDLIQCVTLKKAFIRPVYMAEIQTILKETYGWEANTGYLYDISHEMEQEGLLEGKWTSVRRDKKYYYPTAVGKAQFKQITTDTREGLLQVQKHLEVTLHYLHNL